MAWIGAVVGAAGSVYSANATNKANKGKGQVDMHRWSNPWGPSEPYREAAMRQAYDMMGGGYRNQTTGRRNPDGTWTLGEDPNNRLPTGWLNPGAVQGSGGAGGSAPGRSTAKSGGGSPKRNYTDELLGGMTDRARSGHALYDPANRFTQQLLSGQETNPYRQQAVDTFAGLQDDPQLAQWMAFLQGGDLSGLGDLSALGGGSYRGGGGGGGAQASGIGVDKYIKSILDGQYLDQANPHKDAMLERVRRGVSDEFNQRTLPGINSAFTGAGAFGGAAYERALAQSAGEYTSNLADAVSGIEYGEYEARMQDMMDALGLGTQYDLGVMDANSRAAAAASSASASAYGADRDASTRLALARLGAMGDAVGLGVDLRTAGAQGLGGMAQLYSSDMMDALGLVPELSGLDIRDYGAALEASLGRDQIRGQNASRNAALNWERERYDREEPWLNLMRYSDIINAMSGDYGWTRESGLDRRASSPSYVDPVGQGIAGALAGWQVGQQVQDYYGNRGSGGGSRG